MGGRRGNGKQGQLESTNGECLIEFLAKELRGKFCNQLLVGVGSCASKTNVEYEDYLIDFYFIYF